LILFDSFTTSDGYVIVILHSA